MALGRCFYICSHRFWLHTFQRWTCLQLIVETPFPQTPWISTSVPLPRAADSTSWRPSKDISMEFCAAEGCRQISSSWWRMPRPLRRAFARFMTLKRVRRTHRHVCRHHRSFETSPKRGFQQDPNHWPLQRNGRFHDRFPSARLIETKAFVERNHLACLGIEGKIWWWHHSGRFGKWWNSEKAA